MAQNIFSSQNLSSQCSQVLLVEPCLAELVKLDLFCEVRHQNFPNVTVVLRLFRLVEILVEHPAVSMISGIHWGLVSLSHSSEKPWHIVLQNPQGFFNFLQDCDHSEMFVHILLGFLQSRVALEPVAFDVHPTEKRDLTVVGSSLTRSMNTLLYQQCS